MALRVGTHFVEPLALLQFAVYADVLEGVPNRAVNDGIVADALALAKRTHGLEPVLIPPRERPLGSPSSVALPSICCVGRFRSAKPARDPNAERSEACLVWFQDRFAFPVDAQVAAEIASLVWSDIASDDFM
ncbi:MAG: hypothetical protein H6721_11920 [Sandaracinus sp.]|nr:hypothetical protein [Sandaracinus sp.]MCB9617551.1 hypothetical protein [Sandaracinus sp.]MCB9632830.1 hypothetical protein [Sandaracinus sp.]